MWTRFLTHWATFRFSYVTASFTFISATARATPRQEPLLT
jgi:hypothetical protein